MTSVVASVAPPKVLVVRLPGPAGDAVLATPALRALRRALPGTRIVWSGRAATLALLDGLADRDAVHPIEGALRGGPGAPLRLGRAWRGLGADAVLLLPGSFGAALAARASGAAVRVGYAAHGRGALLTHAIAPRREGRAALPEPMRTVYLRLAGLFGGTDDGRGTRLALTREGEAAATARLARLGAGTRFLAVSPGAAFGPSKVYPARLVAEAVARVRASTGLVPVLLCGPGEEDLAADVARRLGPPVLSTHAEPARWSEAKSLLRRAALLMTPDAGPRHVAAALGTPVVCWMGPTDPRWSAGDEALTTVVRREDLDCLGCHLKVCPIGHPCLGGLDPGLVAAAGLVRMAGGGDAAGASRAPGADGPGTLPGSP